ncbi:hypothetical protein FRC06_011502, partial [Ceratobasidium sp. 370]
MSTVPGCGHNPGPGESCNCSAAASASAAGGAGSGGCSGAGDAATGGGSRGRLGSWSPSTVPGTPGQDAEPEHPDIVEGINPTSKESQYSDLVESLDPTTLVAALQKYIQYDPATLSTQDLKSILMLYVEDHTPALVSAKRKAEALELSQKTSTNVDDGDQAKIDGMPIRSAILPFTDSLTQEPGPERSAKRSRPRPTARMVIGEGDNTDTVDESEIENTESESEPATEPPTPAYEAPSSNHPSRSPSPLPHSPSPLPHSHVPIEPDVLGTLDLPFVRPPHETPGTTQATTQRPVNYLTRPLTRTSTITTEAPLSQRPPARPQSIRNWSLTSLDSITPGQHPPTQSQLEQTALRPPGPTPPSAVPPRAPRNLVSSNNYAGSSRCRDETRSQEHIPVHQLPVDAQTLHQAAELFQFIQGSGKQARVTQERRRGTAARMMPDKGDLDPPRSRAEQLEEDLMHDDEEGRSTRAAEEAGEFPVACKRKPSARDLVGYERQIVSSAKMYLLAYSLKEGAIRTHATFTDWAGDVWIKTWCQHLPHLPPQVASAVIKQVMVNGLATGRGRFKDPVRQLIQYKLKFVKPASTPEAINRNLEIFDAVHPNTFHCTRFSLPYGHYESDLLTQAIALTMFSSPTAIGVVHRKFFDPMPLTTVAFVLAIASNMQFCIEEWETGYFKARDLSMTDLLHKYVAHLRGLKETRIPAKGRMQQLQEHWFEFGYQYSGTIQIQEPYYQPITLRKDVRPDTPEPESESEPEAVDGRYTARAKGKGRA